MFLRIGEDIIRSIRDRLDSDLQSAWGPFYRRCHESWERVMALSGTRYDPGKSVVPWDTV
jgi:hypothetical protein